MGFSRVIRSLVALIQIAALMCAMTARAQVDEAALMAAYIYNITQFTTWPANSVSESRLFVCANGQSNLGIELTKLNGKSFGGRTWVVDSVAAVDGLPKCNVVVLERDTPISRALLEFLASDRPVLVIRTFDAGNRSWVVQLFIDDSHLRFDIDKTEATRRHLTLSSRLLGLARSIL